MSGTENIRKLTEEIKAGYQLVKEKKFEEAKQKLEPYVQVLHSKEKPNVRLLVNYSIAQFGTGDFEGFLQSYTEIKELEATNCSEEQRIKQLDNFFHQVMDHLSKED
ncbi:hypothetical protein [Desertibacillus haloalkaliphilus]|uniref:hypothetical protein n=1 Tax=Desertibacillus haloalkaliphilus TaxID=1328930 RepID=UPI001C255A87|nr:hypothetical protein [Desertibacillus haloalkaliphilus]MBU8908964.1 hypothetical protein [Desertibacillus haloalkaliphilus]